MALILVLEAAQFPNCFAILHPVCQMRCNMRQFEKIIRCKEILTNLNLAILKILFCENDK